MTHPDRIEPYIVETAFGRFVHREFPVLIARVKQARKMKSWAENECLRNVRRG